MFYTREISGYVAYCYPCVEMPGLVEAFIQSPSGELCHYVVTSDKRLDRIVTNVVNIERGNY